ncbi:MAG: hypothetical protein KGR26_01200 [Cyanobacteria bacterium REEB65]|nr:hypothetical protein [Cyanobacteria bacterium REEB65]
MIANIPNCPSCASSNTYIGITIPGEFGCLACGFHRGPDDGFLEPIEEPDLELQIA